MYVCVCIHTHAHRHIRVCVCSGTQLCLTLCNPVDCTCRAPLSMEFPRQEYWNGLLFPTPGDLPDPGIESVSLAPPALAGRFFTTVPPGKHGSDINDFLLMSSCSQLNTDHKVTFIF